MKNLILSVLSGFLLTTQVYAKQQEPNFSAQSVSNADANFSSSSLVQDDTPVKTKSFTRSFNLDKNDKLILANQRGSITIKTWDKNEVKVDVEIRAYAKTDNDAQKMLDEVSINASKTGDLVSYKTEFASRNNNWGSSIRNGKTIWRNEVKIDYTVYMPANIALTASTQYGNILVNDFSGPTSIKVQYGNFNAGTLSNVNNYINVQYGNTTIQEANKALIKQQYGKTVTIGVVGTLDLNVQYADANITTIKGNAVIKKQYGKQLVVGSVDDLDLDAQYTDVTVNAINGDAKIRQQYNKLTLGTIGKLGLNAQYVSTRIGTLKGDGSFNLAYNDLNINYISPACKLFNLKSEYVDVNLGFNESYNGNFEVTKTYGTFKYGNNTTARLLSDESQTKKYSGKIGNGGSPMVRINAEYGTLTFK